MKSILLIAIITTIGSLSTLQAQITNIWKGGFPGQETNWHCSKNWSLGKVPGAFDRVIIPDVSTSTRRYPIIISGEIEVQSIDIQIFATLTLHRSVRVLAYEFICNGTCKGCEQRVAIEGIETDMASEGTH